MIVITFIILSEPNSKFYMIGVVCNLIYFFTKIRLCEEYGKDIVELSKSGRSLACHAMARAAQLHIVSTKCFGQARVLTSEPAAELCQICTIELYLSH